MANVLYMLTPHLLPSKGTGVLRGRMPTLPLPPPYYTLQAAVDAGYSFVCLSDRAFGPRRVPLPSLLATGAVHHTLVGLKARTRVGLLVETGEVRSSLTTDQCAHTSTHAHACAHIHTCILSSTVNCARQLPDVRLARFPSTVLLSPTHVLPPHCATPDAASHPLCPAPIITRPNNTQNNLQAREVHQFCTLVGYGADAVCPYLAFEAAWAAADDGLLPAELSRDDIAAKLIKCVTLTSTCAWVQPSLLSCLLLTPVPCTLHIDLNCLQGCGCGNPQGHGQDGHLHACVLQGCPNL